MFRGAPSVSEYEECFCATDTVEAFGYKESSITGTLLTLTFLSMPLSPVCLQTERFERHFLFARF